MTGAGTRGRGCYHALVAANPRRVAATYADLEALPPHLVGELIGGVLHAHARPRLRHAGAASSLGDELGPPFNRGRGGPGGWILLDEPELHLASDVLVPDLAGWKRARLPELPDEPYLSLAPDWVCEVLSPSTAALDRTDKLGVYARDRVPHVWLLDPDVKLLEVLELDGETYRFAGAHRGGARVRAVPFDAIELDLPLLWSR